MWCFLCGIIWQTKLIKSDFRYFFEKEKKNAHFLLGLSDVTVDINENEKCLQLTKNLIGDFLLEK